MFGTFDRDTWPKYILEKIEFRPAEPLTGRCRGTDRTVIFDQQVACPFRNKIGHVAFPVAQIGNPSEVKRL